MMKSFRKLTAMGLVVLMLLGMLSVSVLAAGAVTISLSRTSGYAGSSVTISGTADAGQWVSIKAVDEDGSIVYFSATVCDSAGAYSDNWVVPNVQSDTLHIIAGYGGAVASVTFTVIGAGPSPSPSPGTDDDDEETIVMTDNSGNNAIGTVKTTGQSTVRINRASFDAFAQISDEEAVVDMNTCVIRFSASTIDAISAAGPGDISLTVREVDAAALGAEAQAMIGTRPAFDFTLTAGTTQITQLGGTAVVSIPYTIRYGEDEDAIVVYAIDTSGTLLPIRGRYNALTQTVEVPLKHFSVYGIGYHKVTFDDVVGADWYYHAVTFCAAREITTGTGNKLFSPDDPLTRGQLIVMLMRAFGIEPDADIGDNFDDAGDAYYTGYLSAAKRLGISNGVGNNLFAPDRPVSRQDMFTLVYRTLNALGEWPEADGAGRLSDFSDAGLVADYAQEAMEMLYKAGVISGSGGALNPLDMAARAQMAKVLYNILSM